MPTRIHNKLSASRKKGKGFKTEYSLLHSLKNSCILFFHKGLNNLCASILKCRESLKITLELILGVIILCSSFVKPGIPIPKSLAISCLLNPFLSLNILTFRQNIAICISLFNFITSNITLAKNSLKVNSEFFAIV